MTGEVLRQGANALRLKTTYAGTLDINWAQVQEVILDEPTTVLLDDETTLEVAAVSRDEDRLTLRQPSGRELVQLLQQRHLFTIPLDAQGEWFRYHHLFQKLLKELSREKAGAEEMATLHSRASAWFESQALITESIEHALVAGDVVRAAEIV